MAEDLTDYLLENGFKVRYLHSEVDTLERIEILRDLRLGEFDVLVGINLLREGLDLPEVTLVAILDADKEGFLRGQTSLIQTIGRAARNVDGKVIMYADKMTAAMRGRDRRDRPAPHPPDGLQRGARHHAASASSRASATSSTMLSDAAAVPTKGRRAAKAVAKKMAMPRRRPREAARQPRGRDVRGGRPAQVRVRGQAARRDQGAQQGARPERRSSWLTPCTCSGSSPRPRSSAPTRAAPLPAAAVVVDDRVNLKCRVPLCSGYGHNLMCPPAVMPADATRDVLRKYGDALVVQLDIPVTQDCVDEQLDGKTYADARSDADQIEGLKESQNRFAHLMTDLERAAFKLGYRYAAAFSGGECVLCDECVGQGVGRGVPAPVPGAALHGGRGHRRRRHGRGGRPAASSCRPWTTRPGPASCSSIERARPSPTGHDRQTESMTSDLIITGAREHNLKDISLQLPRDRFIVITGLSGSGKSSLAFDTIYAEGQRRYVESLSAYARQFLGQMDKPDVDSIEGLSPAISIDQKTTSRNPRSTVGTVTEIYDYLRLLYARVGHPHCPQCGRPIDGQSVAADRRPGAASSSRARASA